MAEGEPAPPLTESARAVFDGARGVAGAWGGHFKALRELVLADLALAREALARALLLLVLAAIVFGTCWALLTVLCVWLLHAAGLGWGLALALPLTVGLVVGAIALKYAIEAFKLAGLDTSREHLRALLDDTGSATKPDVVFNDGTSKTP